MLESYVRPEIPGEIRNSYEEAMSNVYRWKNALTQTTKEESDLEHVAGLFSLADEIRGYYPALAEGMDWEAIDDMIYLHDGGEPFPEVGDYVISNLNQATTKEVHKRRERLGFHWMARKYIKDGDLRKKAEKIYERYVNYSLEDKEALFVHLLDKIQAIRFGLRYVFNDRVLDRDKTLEHAAFSIELVTEYAAPLMKVLDGKMKSELSAFAQVEIGKYGRAGYPELANEARSKFFSATR